MWLQYAIKQNLPTKYTFINKVSIINTATELYENKSQLYGVIRNINEFSTISTIYDNARVYFLA